MSIKIYRRIYNLSDKAMLAADYGHKEPAYAEALMEVRDSLVADVTALVEAAKENVEATCTFCPGRDDGGCEHCKEARLRAALAAFDDSDA